MIANYGYEDGSGFYYITIDGDRCAACSGHDCVSACPQEVYAIETSDYDDLVAVVSDQARKRLRDLCSACKGRNGGGEAEHRTPCTLACPLGAIRHSW
jgi:ferredoxin